MEFEDDDEEDEVILKKNLKLHFINCFILFSLLLL